MTAPVTDSNDRTIVSESIVSIQLVLHPSNYPVICIFIRPSSHLFIYASIHPPIHPPFPHVSDVQLLTRRQSDDNYSPQKNLINPISMRFLSRLAREFPW